MKLNINLATRQYVNFKLVDFILLTSFLLCFSWISFNLYIYVSNSEQVDKISEIMTKNEKGAPGNFISDADYNKFLGKIKNVNTILFKRSYDWITLLESMEQLVPSGVALKSLEPSSKGDSIRLTGTATGFPSIRIFIENLEGSKTFTDVYLTDQSNFSIDNKKQLFNFTVTCKASLP